MIAARARAARPARRDQLFYWSHVGPGTDRRAGRPARASPTAGWSRPGSTRSSPSGPSPSRSDSSHYRARLSSGPRAIPLPEDGASPIMTGHPDRHSRRSTARSSRSGRSACSCIEFVLRRQRVLSTDSPRYEQPDPPLVSAILPAKDEEVNLAECLSLGLPADLSEPRDPGRRRSQHRLGPARSREGSPSVTRASACSRSTTCRRAGPARPTPSTRPLRHARGQWLLFLDADTVHAPESLSIMMEYGRSEGRCARQPAPRAEVRDVLGSGRAAAGGHHLDAVVPASCREQRPVAPGLRQRPVHPDRAHRPTKPPAAIEPCASGSSRTSAWPSGSKPLGLPIRVALVRGLVSCRMYSSFGQLVRGWSRILYDALGRKTWRLVLKLLDPIIFCQSGHVALAAAHRAHWLWVTAAPLRPGSSSSP